MSDIAINIFIDDVRKFEILYIYPTSRLIRHTVDMVAGLIDCNGIIGLTVLNNRLEQCAIFRGIVSGHYIMISLLNCSLSWLTRN